VFICEHSNYNDDYDTLCNSLNLHMKRDNSNKRTLPNALKKSWVFRKETFYAVPNNAALWNDYKNVSHTINLTTYEQKKQYYLAYRQFA
jgi:hypothetical protein